jgi:hypothetical protein
MLLQSSDKVKNLEFCSHVPYIVLYYCTKEKVNKLQEHLIAVNKALSPGQCLLFRNGFFFYHALHCWVCLQVFRVAKYHASYNASL